MTIITGPAWYSPQDDVHRCLAGGVWNATVIPSDRYVGLASPAEGVWVSTGRGQPGVAPTKTAISVDNGSTWAVGGTIPNNANITPLFLTYGNGMLVTAIGSLTGVSYDRGATWALSPGNVGSFSNADMQFGGGAFILVDQANPLVYKSVDGVTSTALATPAIFQRVFWDAYRSRWLCLEATGVRTWTTTDFITFTLRGNLPRVEVTGTDCMAQSDIGTIVMVYAGASALAVRTADGGDTWADTGPVNGSQHTYVLWGNGGFITHRALGSTNERSNDDGLTWVLVSPHTMVKSWIARWDGRNTYVATGATSADDTVANLAIC